MSKNLVETLKEVKAKDEALEKAKVAKAKAEPRPAGVALVKLTRAVYDAEGRYWPVGVHQMPESAIPRDKKGNLVRAEILGPATSSLPDGADDE